MATNFFIADKNRKSFLKDMGVKDEEELKKDYHINKILEDPQGYHQLHGIFRKFSLRSCRRDKDRIVYRYKGGKVEFVMVMPRKKDYNIRFKELKKFFYFWFMHKFFLIIFLPGSYPAKSQ